VSFAPDYAATPYWNDDQAYPAGSTAALPPSADVVVVGAGYTGLSAARETAMAGRSTLVLDAGPIGGGASSRNGGQVAFSIKPEFSALSDR
jgi:NADPH-dependent 2,4-dienoyl-CoA reductase/sulfur reductase-like enzyme